MAGWLWRHRAAGYGKCCIMLYVSKKDSLRVVTASVVFLARLICNCVRHFRTIHSRVQLKAATEGALSCTTGPGCVPFVKKPLLSRKAELDE